MKRRAVLILVPGLALALAASAPAAEIAGKWKAEFETMVGVQTYLFEFTVDGDTISGKAQADRAGEKEEVTLSDVKLEGDKLSFAETMTWQGQSVDVTYEGTVTEEEIQLTREVGGFASEKLVAKRVED
jgi:hypothetical protein